MPTRLFARAWGALMALALLVLLAPPLPLAAAEENVKCASCGKEVKKSKAIKVIQDGRIYYVCSKECADKIKKK
jgi:hypothetical protein